MSTTHRWTLAGIFLIASLCVAARPPAAAVQVMLNDRLVERGGVIEANAGSAGRSSLIFVLQNAGERPLRLSGPLKIRGEGADRIRCASPPEANGELLAPGQRTAFRIELAAGGDVAAGGGENVASSAEIDVEVTVAVEAGAGGAFSFRIRTGRAGDARSAGRVARGQQYIRDAAGIPHPDFL
jgi:hypothetical protein